MIEINAFLKLMDFAQKNNTESPSFKCFVGHNENEKVYGVLYDAGKDLIFQQHKWVKVNEGKSAPKVCEEIIYKHKIVGEEIFNSFKEIEYSDYISREINDNKTL